jgi:hypothetical protein
MIKMPLYQSLIFWSKFLLLIVTVTSNFLFKNFMVTVIAGHWTTWIFHVVIGPLGKIEFTIRYTHL